MMIEGVMTVMEPSLLTDECLTERLSRLALDHRRTLADLLLHLSEFDVRELHLRAGYSSLFVYCTTVLRLSEHEAYHRIDAARDVKRFPVLLDRLREGSLTLTTLRLLGGHLTPDNHVQLLEAAAFRSKRQVAELIAGLAPRPDVASSVRALPAARPRIDDAQPAPRVGSPLAGDLTRTEPVPAARPPL